METSLLLAQFFGLFYLIVGIVVVIRQNIVRELVDRFAMRPLTMWVSGMLAFALGLLIVLSHNVWDTLWQAIISFIGWAYMIEGVAYMLMPQGLMARWVRYFNTPAWYIGGGIISILAGLYLTSIGFGWM